VSEVKPGAVSAEVGLALEGGGSLAAVVTRDSVRELGLRIGRRVTALVKASDVILAVVS
jgi:molybdate transport system regulatory protein